MHTAKLAGTECVSDCTHACMSSLGLKSCMARGTGRSHVFIPKSGRDQNLGLCNWVCNGTHNGV